MNAMTKMGTRADAADDAVEAMQALSSEIRMEQYELSRMRPHAVVTVMRPAREEAQRELPRGYEPFGFRHLAQVGNAWLVIDPAGPRSGVSYGSRLVRSVVVVGQDAADLPIAINHATAEILGRFTPESAPEPGRWFAPTRDLERAWNGLWDAWRWRLVLPLAGPIAEIHGPCRRLARLAQRLEADEPWMEVLAIDQELDSLDAAGKDALTRARAAALAGTDEADLLARRANEVEQMKWFDWTWDHKDRTDPEDYERHEAFMRMMAAIPVAERRALWLLKAYDPLGITPWRRADWARWGAAD